MFRLVRGHRIAPGVDLREANLWDADLAGAVLVDARLGREVLTVATLSDTNFIGAELTEVWMFT